MALSMDELCSRLEHLRLDRSGGLVKPYEPLLVATVVILIHKHRGYSCAWVLDIAGDLTLELGADDRSRFSRRDGTPSWPEARRGLRIARAS